MDRDRPQIKILNKESALAAVRVINLKGGADMKEKEFIILDPGIADEIITSGYCCFFSLLPLISR